jgi:hypothetical protein
MIGDHVGGWAGNLTSTQQQQHEQRTINNGPVLRLAANGTLGEAATEQEEAEEGE